MSATTLRGPLLPIAIAIAAGGVATGRLGPASGAPSGEVVRVEHRDPHALPARGPSNALVTIEVFFTPVPTGRHQAIRNLERLQAEHPSRIRLVYRLVKGSMARLPYAALYAYSEGKFFELMDALSLPAAQRSLDDRALLELGRRLGLDPERMAAAIMRPPAAYDAVLAANENRRKQKFRSNPTLPNVLFNGQVTSKHVTSLSMADLEREYAAAKERALELLDRGVARRDLPAAFDQVVALPDEIVVQPGPTDEEIEDPSLEPRLARPPLDYRGFPARGPAEAPITIAVLCSPISTNCNAPIANAQRVAEIYGDRVRVVWGPYFNVGREDAAELSLLADAALCAERDGGRAIDRDDTWDPKDSPGWRWVREVLAQVSTRGRRLTTEQLIDRVVERLRVESRAFATCRARLAGASIKWIENARRSGVRSTPATVVNGRIYGPINDTLTLQLLVETELAPGLLAPAWTRGGPQ
jgi:hypothetical protein